jgi:hypothetical protein
MRITELIRGVLDIIDGVDQNQTTDPSPSAYKDTDIKRFKQIVDLADQGQPTEYSNTPKEEYASLDAVTVDAGADGLNGTKHPADIRSDSVAMYPGTTYGAK